MLLSIKLFCFQDHAAVTSCRCLLRQLCSNEKTSHARKLQRGAHRCSAVRQRAAQVQHCRALCHLGADIALPAGLAEAMVARSRAHLLDGELIKADLALVLHGMQHCKQESHASPHI